MSIDWAPELALALSLASMLVHLLYGPLDVSPHSLACPALVAHWATLTSLLFVYASVIHDLAHPLALAL